MMSSDFFSHIVSILKKERRAICLEAWPRENINWTPRLPSRRSRGVLGIQKPMLLCQATNSQLNMRLTQEKKDNSSNNLSL